MTLVTFGVKQRTLPEVLDDLQMSGKIGDCAGENRSEEWIGYAFRIKALNAVTDDKFYCRPLHFIKDFRTPQWHLRLLWRARQIGLAPK